MGEESICGNRLQSEAPAFQASQKSNSLTLAIMDLPLTSFEL